MSSFEEEIRREKHDEAAREREAGMYRKNDGLGGHSGVHSNGHREEDDREERDDRDHRDERYDEPHRRERSREIEAPTNIIYEAPRHIEDSHEDNHASRSGYGGQQRNALGSLLMFLILIGICIYGYMSITHTSLPELIQMISGNHTAITVQIK